MDAILEAAFKVRPASIPKGKKSGPSKADRTLKPQKKR